MEILRLAGAPDRHGTPWSSWLWRPFAEALSSDFTVFIGS
jgi:hypothetical protein